MTTIQIAFLDADAARPDPAQTGAAARAAVASLRAEGYDVAPAYDGTMGGELFELVRALADGAAANKDVVLAMFTGIAAPIIAALAARRPEKPAATPPPPAAAAPQITVIIAGVAAPAEPGISEAELLQRLLAADPALPQRITPDSTVRIEVRVPPRG